MWWVCFENLVFIIKIIWPKKLVFLEDDIFHISLNIYQIIENILLCILESWDTNIWIPVFQIMNKCFEIPTQLLKFNRLFNNNPSVIWFCILKLLLINLWVKWMIRSKVYMIQCTKTRCRLGHDGKNRVWFCTTNKGKDFELFFFWFFCVFEPF